MPQNLRILAVAAPENETGSIDDGRIYSRDPASLYNAMRYAAWQAANNPGSAWTESNLVGDRKTRRDKFLLMSSLDDMPEFERKLAEEKPNILFLGAMTLCLPGAVACAKKAREVLGDDVLIVLGGYHINETMFQIETGLIQIGGVEPGRQVIHHTGSPLRLMDNGKISAVQIMDKSFPIFDLVISGHAEHIIAEIGEVAARALKETGSTRNVQPYLPQVNLDIPGDWIIGYVQDGMKTIISNGKAIDYNKMPSPASMFGVGSYFGVFQNNPDVPTPTAHTYSDTGGGCVYTCDFCSEGYKPKGSLIDASNSPTRLYRQLREAEAVINVDHPGAAATAFVEDSIFLGGSRKFIEDFCSLMEKEPRSSIRFGCQFTVNQALEFGKSGLLKRLHEAGLDYVFMGIETLNPDEIEGGMHKDRKRGYSIWADGVEGALIELKKAEIKSGAAVLFGLGEPHSSRVALLDKIDEWRRISLHTLRPISINWAVLHPLRDVNTDIQYDYLQWGTSKDSPLMPLSHAFGEFSERYFMPKAGTPKLDEVRQIVERVQAMNAVDDRGTHSGRAGATTTRARG